MDESEHSELIPLTLADLKGYTPGQLLDHIMKNYEAKAVAVGKYDILVAYESVGDYGCDSTSWFLMRDPETGKLYENHGSHCSCYGFEEQWDPQETSLEYLQSDKMYIPTGGYDDESNENTVAIKKYIADLKK